MMSVDKNGVELSVLSERPNVSSSLLELCFSGSFEQVVDAVDLGASVHDVKSSDLSTALHAACRRTKRRGETIKIVRFLLDNKSVMSPDHIGRTPVHVAAIFCFAEVVEMLLKDRKGLVNLSDQSGFSALHLCCFRTKKVDESVKVASSLLANGGRLESKDYRGRTPLMIACSSGSVEMVKFLLSKGAKVNAVDEQGESALHRACQNGMHGKEMLSILLDAKADVNIKNHKGHDPLSSAIRKGPEMTKAFLALLPANSKPSNFFTGPDDPLGSIQMWGQCGGPVLTSAVFSRWIAAGCSSGSVWASMRVTRPNYDGSAKDWFVAISQCSQPDIWINASREPSMQQHPISGDTLFHVLCRSNKLDAVQKMEVFQALKRDFYNPLTPNAKGERAVDLATDVTLKSALFKYMEWQPNRWVMHWFGPIFRKRAFTFLLCTKQFRFPKDVRLLLVKYLSQIETVYN